MTKMGSKRTTPQKPLNKKSINTIPKLKRKLWTIFSTFTRMRDCFESTGSTEWGFCFTCGKRYHFKLLQAGHFIPGRNNAVLFSERGVHAQCYNCNINLKGNTLEYRRGIIKKYGDGVDEELEEESRQTIKFTVSQLEEMIIDYKKRIKELEQANRT